MYNHSYFYFVVIYDLTPGKNHCFQQTASCWYGKPHKYNNNASNRVFQHCISLTGVLGILHRLIIMSFHFSPKNYQKYKILATKTSKHTHNAPPQQQKTTNQEPPPTSKQKYQKTQTTKRKNRIKGRHRTDRKKRMKKQISKKCF